MPDMVELHTERLILRRACDADLDDLFAVFSDARAMRYWSELPHSDPVQTKDYLGWLQSVHDARGTEFVVELQGRVIGKAGIWDESEIGYILHPDCWGQGIGTEAARAVIDHVFDVTGLTTITADVDPRNTVSCRMLERLGFRETGFAEKTLQLGDEWCDSVYYTLLPETWFQMHQTTRV